MSELSRKVFLAETAAVNEHLAEQEQQATAKAEAALAPLEAKARALREQQRAEYRAAVLRDFLWRLEQSAGDATAEKFLDDNPELRRMADEAQPADAPTESFIYEVVGDWGVDSADSAEGARAAVAKWLRAYPKCGAFAQQRLVREWPDGSEFYGPWTDLPAEALQDGAQP